MATNTTNYNLVKPGYDDVTDISDINGNMDIIDTTLNNLATNKENKLSVQTKQFAQKAIAAFESGYVTVDVTRTGYTPIGIVGIRGSGTGGLAYSDFYISSGNAIIYYRETQGNARNTTLNAIVLYSKN